MIYKDQAGLSKTSQELTTKGTSAFMMKFASMKLDQRFLAIWTYHVPTKTLVTEHNFTMFFSKRHLQSLPRVMKALSKVEHFESALPSGTPAKPPTLDACRIHCEQWVPILELDVRMAMDYHSTPGIWSRVWDSKSQYQREMLEILQKKGEHDPSGDCMCKRGCFSKKPSKASAVDVPQKKSFGQLGDGDGGIALAGVQPEFVQDGKVEEL